MQLTRVYVRFYKSFNYDYERKFVRGSRPDPWELVDGTWYPYVRMDVDPSITTIVGANESGKSHLLDAIEKLITGEGIDRSDFCRYSHFFSVEQGKRRSPDFGGEFEVLNSDDVALAKKHLALDLAIGDRFHIFRASGKAPLLYPTNQTEPKPVSPKASDLSAVLPSVFRLDANVPLPASIPLHELASGTRRPLGSRRSRRAVVEGMLGKSWPNLEDFTKAAPTLFGLLGDSSVQTAKASDSRQYELGRALLFRVAKIDPTTFKDLADAIADEREGYVQGIIQKINSSLATHLNFPRWWAQDREFRLTVSPREYELVFTIRDRTGTDYSFAERSGGLKFFLSYHVQLLAHEPQTSGRPEILLMDEPDAYLSSQGQQDLLRILEEFAQPEDKERRDQILYVTHSPFLINRNSGDRIRVLDKGVTDEGTRVVKDVARNHYEPLRSSLGAFVAETSFIGGSNLFVEGLADQVLLAGMSAHLLHSRKAAKLEVLDLNNVTIVPAGSASSLPYLVYLARGRDVVRPPCVALLDSDSAGTDAAKALARGGARNKEVLPSDFVLQIGEWAKVARLSIVEGVVVKELEDLVSLPLALAAARSYAVKVCDVAREKVELFTGEHIAGKLTSNSGSLFDALKSAFAEQLGPDAHIEKVGFAKEVVGALVASRTAKIPPDGWTDTEQNVGQLLAALSKMLRKAHQREEDRRLSNRLNRTVAGFLADYQTTTTRERGRLLIEEVQASLENSEAGDELHLATEKLRRDFNLDENLTQPIDHFAEFRDRVAALKYEERLAKRARESAVSEVQPPAIPAN